MNKKIYRYIDIWEAIKPNWLREGILEHGHAGWRPEFWRRSMASFSWELHWKSTPKKRQKDKGLQAMQPWTDKGIFCDLSKVPEK